MGVKTNLTTAHHFNLTKVIILTLTFLVKHLYIICLTVLLPHLAVKHYHVYLKNTFTDPYIIQKHQAAIKEFAPQHSLREQVIAKSLLYKDGAGNLDNIQYWLNEKVAILSNKWISIARFTLPAMNLLTLIISFYLDHYSYLIASVFICWLHVGYFAKYIQRQHVLLGKKQEVLDQYAIILNEFSNVEINTSDILKEYKTCATEAYGEVKKLAQLSNLLDQRMNVLVNIFLNSFLLYDVQVTAALEKWKLRNKQHFASWMECVGNIESLASLSTFAFNYPSFCYPTLVDELTLEATSLAHPLINSNERVTNDVSIGNPGKLLLVTGSNMSGKTTYLRTIGINIVLAQCGAPVCAESFSFKPVHVYTSIRISDSLQDHTSYFMAELKRLSEIKENISSLQPSLVLIDEILRGTNSEDKYFGSAQFVKKLIQYNCLTLFATHDLKLSELENEHEGLIENYCFESIIKEDELIFDYKVRKGVAQNKNASFLMKKMKII
jgi:hypothetical protein